MAKRTTLGAKSQTVVPRVVQERLGIGQGDQVEWSDGPGRSVIVRGFRSVPAHLITPELEKKLDARDQAMEQGRSFSVKSVKNLDEMAERRRSTRR